MFVVLVFFFCLLSFPLIIIGYGFCSLPLVYVALVACRFVCRCGVEINRILNGELTSKENPPNDLISTNGKEEFSIFFSRAFGTAFAEIQIEI